MANNFLDYPFGLCEITYGEEAVPRIGDAVVFKATPEYVDITSYLMGGTVDKIIKRWNVTVDVVFEQETAEVMGLCIPLNEGLDAEMGKSLRNTAKELVLHPMQYGSDKSKDITIFKAVSTGEYERVYSLDNQSKIKVTFTALVKDDAVSGDPGNFFRIGAAPSPASLAE